VSEIDRANKTAGSRQKIELWRDFLDEKQSILIMPIRKKAKKFNQNEEKTGNLSKK